MTSLSLLAGSTVTEKLHDSKPEYQTGIIVMYHTCNLSVIRLVL